MFLRAAIVIRHPVPQLQLRLGNNRNFVEYRIYRLDVGSIGFLVVNGIHDGSVHLSRPQLYHDTTADCNSRMQMCRDKICI